MMKIMRGMCIAVLAGLVISSTAAATPLQLIWEPWQTGDVGAVGDWLLVANISQPDAVVGWGLDLKPLGAGPYNFSVDAYGPDWSEVTAMDPDPTDSGVLLNFAAINVILPNGIYGPHVVLAALTLSGVTNPFTQVTVLAHGPGQGGTDLNEGFARDPMLPGTPFISFNLIPEPTTVVLLGLGLLGLMRRR